MDLQAKLTEIATSVRRVMERKEFDFAGFPWGSCNLASYLLSKYLVEVVGLRKVDGRANGERFRPSNDPERDWPFRDCHMWMEHAGFIIDITADQFADCSEPVIVTTDRTWHEQFEGHTPVPQSEMIDLNRFNMGYYRRLLEILGVEGSPG